MWQVDIGGHLGQVGGGGYPADGIVCLLAGYQPLLYKKSQGRPDHLQRLLQDLVTDVADNSRVSPEGKVDGDTKTHCPRPDNPHFFNLFQAHLKIASLNNLLSSALEMTAGGFGIESSYSTILAVSIQRLAGELLPTFGSGSAIGCWRDVFYPG